MSQEDLYYFNWITTGSLGTSILWSSSELSVGVKTNSDVKLKYQLVAGSLPSGISLTDDGLLTGVFSTATTTLNLYFLSTSTSTKSIVTGTSVLAYGLDFSTATMLSSLELGDTVKANNPGITYNTTITNIGTDSITISQATTSSLTTGTILSFFRPTTTFFTSTFSVSVSKIGGTALTTGSFSLTVKNSKDLSFCQVYLSPQFTQSQRQQWYKFINDSTVFNKQSMYRLQDPNFGIQKDIKFVVHYDYQLQSLSNFVSIFTKNFYKRRFTLSDVRTRVAKKNNTVIYEVVYLDIIDYNTNSSNESTSKVINWQPGFEVYPSSFDNMRKQLEENGSINPEIRPLHFNTLQANDERIVGYIPCIVLCYTLPGKSKLIVDNIKKQQIKFNQYDFDIDKVFIKNHYTGESSVINLTQNPVIT